MIDITVIETMLQQRIDFWPLAFPPRHVLEKQNENSKGQKKIASQKWVFPFHVLRQCGILRIKADSGYFRSIVIGCFCANREFCGISNVVGQ